MIKVSGDCNVYTDDSAIFTVEVEVDNTNDTRTITLLKGPGILGNVSKTNADTFLSLMYAIADDLSANTTTYTAESITVDASEFIKNLSSEDVNVQLALATLDALDTYKTAKSITVDASEFIKNLSSEDINVQLALDTLDALDVLSINGGVYITNVEPQNPADNISNKVYDSSGRVLLSCTSSTLDVTVSVMAKSGSLSYAPEITVNTTAVTLSESSDKPMWTGDVDVTLDATGATDVTAVHNEGAESNCTITVQAAPAILTAAFVGSYPGSQTELKEGDYYDVAVTTDIPMTSIVVSNYGAAKSETFNFTAITSTIITIEIADRGDTVQSLIARLKAGDSLGAYGSTFDTTNTVDCNNVYPTITFGTKTYPGVQEALKASEQATIGLTLVNYDSYLPSYPLSQLLEITKIPTLLTVQRVGGTYNINNNNLSISATRNANDATTVSSTVVFIADATPVITITEPATRLRSSPSGALFVITLSSTQRLLNTPSLSPVGGAGSWSGSWGGGPISYTRSLSVTDSGTKGTHTWQSLTATNLAGTVVNTTTEQYTLGGFYLRTMTIAAWPTREGGIGTQVSDASKLLCTNLSKGGSGSHNFTYKSTVADQVDYYSITQPTGIANSAGNLWYNCDAVNASSNTSGTMQVELEETV